MSHLRDWEIEAELASDMEPSDDEDHVEEDIHESDEQSIINDEEFHDNLPEPEAMEVEEPEPQLQSPPSPAPDERPVKLGNTSFVRHGNMLRATKTIMKGKEKRGHTAYKWSTRPPPPHRIPGRNIVPFMPGPIGVAREVMNELASFELFFDESILETILLHTNQEIVKQKANYASSPSFVKSLHIVELKAYIGILFLTAVKKDNRVATEFLWGVSGSEIYSAVMSKERFKFITNCLRFDDRETRDARKSDDFTHIRDIWEKLMKKCSDLYRPSVNCTIDEQLVGFRGRCKFRIYIPSKPDKYGLKMVLMCDSYNRFVISGMPYLGKNTPNGNSPLAEYFVENLTKSVHGTNINITYDNWFTSIPLAKKMLSKYKLTTVGTLRKNKTEIPPDTLVTKNRPIGSSIFLYNSHDQLQLNTYCPKKGKMVLLLSNMHYEAAISESTGKPEVIEYYNSTKAGVDAIDQMCHSYSCSRRTRRWPMAIFYKMLDLAGINARTTLNMNKSRKGDAQISRSDFLYKLSLALIIPFMKTRLTIPNLRHDIKEKIESVVNEMQKLESNQPQAASHMDQESGNETEPHASSAHQATRAAAPRQGRCSVCKPKKDKKFAVKCTKCSNFICKIHRTIICDKCATQQ